MSEIRRTDLGVDEHFILPVKTRVSSMGLTNVANAELLIKSALLEKRMKTEKDIYNGQETTKRIGIRHETYRLFFSKLFEFLVALIKFGIRLFVFVLILTVVGVSGLIYHAVDNGTVEVLSGLSYDVSNFDLPNSIITWLQIVIGIAQIIVPIFL